jgi:hypothetical protein
MSDATHKIISRHLDITFYGAIDLLRLIEREDMTIGRLRRHPKFRQMQLDVAALYLDLKAHVTPEEKAALLEIER